MPDKQGNIFERSKTLSDKSKRLEIVLLQNVLHIISATRIFFHQSFNRIDCMNDGGMIAPAEVQADGFQGAGRRLFCDVHGNLPGLRDFLFARLGAQEIIRNREILADDFLDVFDADVARFR